MNPATRPTYPPSSAVEPPAGIDAWPDVAGALAGFVDFLRQHGWTVGLSTHADMLRAARVLGPVSAPVMAAAWRSIACHHRREWRQFNDLFDAWWFPHRVRGTVKVSGSLRPSRDLRSQVLGLHQAMAEQGAGSPEVRPDAAPRLDTALDVPPPAMGADDDAGLSRARGGASRHEPLLDRAFERWLPQDLSQLEHWAERIAQRLRHAETRRQQVALRGRSLDVRRTLRASLRTGGLPLDPVWRRRRRDPPRLFLLVDVSRSMETHAQLFLRISRAFVLASDARAFVFHTRLAEVTPLLMRDTAAVQAKVNALTAGFGGGTRIATSLDDFLRVHARGQVDRRARIWLLSDGFDADAPDALRVRLSALRQRGARISWFHPGPQPPASAAVSAAADLIEHWLPLNCLNDLARAAEHLH